MITCSLLARSQAPWSGKATQRSALVPRHDKHTATGYCIHRSSHCMKASNRKVQSFDSEDDLDGDLTGELVAIADPERLKRMAKHFELAWSISAASSRPSICTSCRGTRERECDWCHGTGVMTVGDNLFCSTSSHNCTCPVCKATGYVKCENCRGTGFRAVWLPDK